MSLKKNIAQFDRIFNISHVQDSKIIVKDSPRFSPNFRPRSHNSFSSFNHPPDWKSKVLN